jgi:DNA-binding response OmpR family regulator
MRILVVDDDPSVRRLLSVQLGLAGHEVHIAEDGAGALTEVGRQRPDVLLLDVMMPLVDGWQVLEALRAKPAYADLPVILLTAKSLPNDVDHSYDLGATVVMPKPYDGDRLLAMIEAVTAQAELLRKATPEVVEEPTFPEHAITW